MSGSNFDAVFCSAVPPQVAPERTVVLMTWEGTRPQLKAVMLNSHYDVGDTPVSALCCVSFIQPCSPEVMTGFFNL